MLHTIYIYIYIYTLYNDITLFCVICIAVGAIVLVNLVTLIHVLIVAWWYSIITERLICEFNLPILLLYFICMCLIR